MEGQAKGLMDVFAALAAVEQILLNVVADGEERATRRVGRGVDTVGTRNPASKCACATASEYQSKKVR